MSITENLDVLIMTPRSAHQFGIGEHGLGYESSHVEISNHIFVEDIDKKVQRMGSFGFTDHLSITNPIGQYWFVHNTLLTVHKDMGTGSIGFLDRIEYKLNLLVNSIPYVYIFRRQSI